MELRQLRVFVAVAAELHFGRAAERLHLAQPPVSRTIRQLEQELGHDLFERSTRAVTLTPAGKALVAPAQRMLALEAEAISEVEQAALGRSGVVRMAYAGVSTNSRVGELARRIRREVPDIHLQLNSQHFAAAGIDKLYENQIDIALGRWDHVPDDIATRMVYRDELVVAMPDSHPRANQESVAIADLLADEWVTLAMNTNSVLNTRLSDLMRAHGKKPRIAQEAPDTLSAISLVSAEVGVSLTLRSVANNVWPWRVAFVPLIDESAPVDLLMAWRRDDPSPTLRTVLDISGQLIEGNEDAELNHA